MTLMGSGIEIIDGRTICRTWQITRKKLHELRQDPTFPAPLRFDPDNPRSHVRFFVHEIRAFLEQRQQLTSEAAAGKRLGIGPNS
jgi:hypothetical protein